MPSQERLPGKTQSQLPTWYYVGFETIELDGTDAQQVTIPSEGTIFVIKARGGEVYFAENSFTASALSGGYVPEDTGEIVGPHANLASLWVFSTTASTVAHIRWYREA